MRLQKSCDLIVGHSPAAARPDKIVGKKTKSFYCFFPHVNSDWIAKESGTAAAWQWGGARRGGYLEAKTWDIPWSKPAAAHRAAVCCRAALRYIVH